MPRFLRFNWRLRV